MANQTFVSPGVYTSEKDITFVTRQIGVTTLGLVGETTMGPAFQPIFITNYDEFKSFFGGLNATKVIDTGAPQYELPYIAKSYLSQSNQLYITRVLGYSGYDAGKAWGITLNGAINTTTTGQTATSTYNPLISYTATTGGTLTLVSNDSLIQSLINNGSLTSQLAFLSTAATGATTTIGITYLKIGSSFSGVSFNLYVKTTGTSGSNTTGTTTGNTTYYSGTSYSDVENKLVALLRSRGSYNGVEVLNFQITGSNITIDTSVSAATTNPLAEFSLSGISNTQGAFQYSVSLDSTNKNYLPRVLGVGAQDGKTAVFVEELYKNMFDDYVSDGKVLGLKLSLINYNLAYDDYLQQFSPAVTPYIVSELRGTNLLRLFRFWTISDGNAANKQFKISIINIKPDERTFDVLVRSFFDTDANPNILERFSNCTMDPTSLNFISRKIGSLDSVYPSKSNYVLVELDDTSDTSDAFPAGFVGVPRRPYTDNGNTSVVAPTLAYKQTYGVFENKRKFYLGLSDTIGIDQDFFDYKGVPDSSAIDQYTGMTRGFHMDIDASAATIDGVSIVINATGGTYSPVFLFDVGCCEFRTNADLDGTDYEKIYARKFTLAPYGGFDGWDIYRTKRTNTDTYTINGTKGALGLTTGNFTNRTLTNGDNGTTSDYYAYLEAIWTFRNPEAVNINVLATPGIEMIDNSDLVEATIEMTEVDRADSIYIPTLADIDSAGTVLSVSDVAADIDGLFDSNYTATYWPWIQILDAENNVNIFVPPTRDVVRNIALTDNIAFPWFATAGLNRGSVDAIKARVKLTQGERDTLYENRINPIATFSSDGVIIWGNKTLQVAETALNRVNVRRLLLQTRKLIAAVSLRLVFEQNDTIVRNQFLSLVNPILDSIRTSRGLIDFRVTIDSSPEAFDRNEMSGKIFIKPTRALEIISLEFNIVNNSVSFDDI